MRWFILGAFGVLLIFVWMYLTLNHSWRFVRFINRLRPKSEKDLARERAKKEEQEKKG
jgi:hypothetical protein